MGHSITYLDRDKIILVPVSREQIRLPLGLGAAYITESNVCCLLLFSLANHNTLLTALFVLIIEIGNSEWKNFFNLQVDGSQFSAIFPVFTIINKDVLNYFC